MPILQKSSKWFSNKEIVNPDDIGPHSANIADLNSYAALMGFTLLQGTKNTIINSLKGFLKESAASAGAGTVGSGGDVGVDGTSVGKRPGVHFDDDENNKKSRVEHSYDDGFDLAAFAEDEDMSSLLASNLASIAYFYNPTLAALSTQAVRLKEALRVKKSVSRGDLLIIPMEEIIDHFGASSLAVAFYMIYRVQSVSNKNVMLEYTTFTGEKPADFSPVEEVTLLPSDFKFALTIVGRMKEVVDAQFPAKISTMDATEQAGMRGYYDKFDGKLLYLHAHDKGKVDDRVRASALARRLIEREMWEWLCLNDIDFDVDKAWDKLLSRAQGQLNSLSTLGIHQMHTDDFETGVLFKQLHFLPCCTGIDVFKALLMGQSSKSLSFSKFDLNLQQFTIHNLNGQFTDMQKYQFMYEAVKNFGVFLQFACGEQYANIMDGVADMIMKGKLRDWMPDYVRYLIEAQTYHVLCEIRDVSKADFMAKRGYEDVDISSPEGVRELFRRAFLAMQPEERGQNRFLRESMSSTNSLPKPKLPFVPTLGAQNSGATLFCRFAFLQDLEIKSIRGSNFKCMHGNRCRFQHLDVSTMNKHDLHKSLNVLATWKSPTGEIFLKPDLLKTVRAAVAARPN